METYGVSPILRCSKRASMTLALTSEETTTLLPAALTYRYKYKGIGKWEHCTSPVYIAYLLICVII